MRAPHFLIILIVLRGIKDCAREWNKHQKTGDRSNKQYKYRRIIYERVHNKKPFSRMKTAFWCSRRESNPRPFVASVVLFISFEKLFHM